MFKQTYKRVLKQPLRTLLVVSFLSTAALSSTVANAHMDLDENYIITRDSKCKITNPYPEEGEYVMWSGTCKDGYADGQGTMTWYINDEKNLMYIGNLTQGEMNGKGEMTYYPSDEYEAGHYQGDYKDDMQDGKGVYTWDNGSFFEGEWQEDERSGLGRFTLVSGDESIEAWEYDEQGGYVDGDESKDYVIEGLFFEDELLIECDIDDPTECKEAMLAFLDE